MLRRWRRDLTPDEQHLEIEPDPCESPFELPPVDGLPFASDAEKSRAIRRVIEQAEYERASASPPLI